MTNYQRNLVTLHRNSKKENVINMNNHERLDLTEWVIHFVHDRCTKDIPELYEDSDSGLGHFPMPDYFDEEGNPHTFYEKPYQDSYELYGDSPAFSILCKIINDGFLKSGWAFRNKNATIYGPKSAVCFTEMPLYALIDYVNARKDSGYVGRYGIAFRREELFEAGARPVIYGLTGEHKEISSYESFCGFRALSECTGIGLHEQYRYVYTNLPKKRDWSFEREWRWALPEDTLGVAGLPFMLEEHWQNPFSEIIILVSTNDEASQICNILKNIYESRTNNYGDYYDLKLIESTKVVSFECLEENFPDPTKIKIEDIPFRYKAGIPHITVNEETLNHVKIEIHKAGLVAKKAIEDYLIEHPNAQDYGLFGFAWVYTYELTEVTQALLDLNMVQTYADGCYRFYLDQYMQTYMIDLLEKGTQAAADYLTSVFHQKFYMGSRLD